MATDNFPIFPLPLYVPIFSNVETAWTDNYAPFRVATKYAGIKLPEIYKVLCYWSHGCDLPIREINPDLVTGCLPIPKEMPIFTGRRETRDFMRKHGFQNVKSIGLPIVYTEEFEYPRQPGSLLVMPMHSIGGENFEEKWAFEKYVQEIAGISKNFNNLTVVIHQSCIENKLWIREFQSIGAKIVPGAYPNDANCLSRIKILLQQHDFMTTNEWGSHVAYALAFGLKVSIWGTAYEREFKHHLIDSGWRSRPDLAKLVFSSDFETIQKKYLGKLYIHPEESVSDVKWGNWLIGSDQKLSSEEMRDCLNEMIDYEGKKTSNAFKIKNFNIYLEEKPLIKNNIKINRFIDKKNLSIPAKINNLLNELPEQPPYQQEYHVKSPIAMIVFNRVEQTQRVFDQIRRAKPSRLFLIADGPRSHKPDDSNLCRQVRDIVCSVDWACEVITHFSETNMGCTARIVSGLDWVFEQVESCIILEDDCLPCPDFFRFCDTMLKTYEHSKEVACISGNNFQFGIPRGSASHFYTPHILIWGWATWRRAWKHNDVKMQAWPKLRETNFLAKILNDPIAESYWRNVFDAAFRGQTAWDCPWVFSCWANRSFGICPEADLISNIGFDQQATGNVSSLNPIFVKIYGNIHPGRVREQLNDKILLKFNFTAFLWTQRLHYEQNFPLLRREYVKLLLNKNKFNLYNYSPIFNKNNIFSLLDSGISEIPLQEIDKNIEKSILIHAEKNYKIFSNDLQFLLCAFLYSGVKISLSESRRDLDACSNNGTVWKTSTATDHSLQENKITECCDLRKPPSNLQIIENRSYLESSDLSKKRIMIFPDDPLQPADFGPPNQEVEKKNGPLSNFHWTQLDQIYTECRRELYLRSDEWRYGPERVMLVAKEAYDHLVPHGSIVGKFYCDLGCGIYHPYGISSIMYLNGARETLSTDLQPSDPSRTAEALADLLLDVVLDPARWHWTDFPRAEFLSRLHSFDLKALKNGDLSTGIRRLPLRYILTDIHNPALPVGKIDFLSSRAVLEHFLDFPKAMARMGELLAPDGIAFHNIDLVDHRAYESQSFHFWSFLAEGDAYSDGVCNRLRASEILRILKEKGFEILFREPHRDKMPEGFWEKIQGRFRQLSIEDLETTSIKVTVRKTSVPPDDSAENSKGTKFHETGEPAASSLFSTNHQDVESSDYSKKKILIFSDDPGQGGVAHHAHSLITALLKAGAKVFSAQPEMQSPLLDEQRLLGAEIIWTGYNPSKEFLRSAEDEADAERIMVSAQPDLIIFNDSCVMSHIAAKNVAIQNLLPFISICNTDTEYLALRFPKLMPAVEKHFYFAQQVVAVSESVLTTLRRTFALSGDKGVVVYYGRPERFFEASEGSARVELRKELGVPADAVLCLTTARMVADKGYQFQFEAIKMLKTSGRMGNLYFAWAGDGDLRTKFVELVKNAGLQDRVKVLGYRWDVDNLMSASDIFVLPSLVEAMPLSIMEAMAKGMPVIASSIAGVPEELGSTGCLLPNPGKEPQQAISQLVETLSSWASDVPLRKKLGLDSHERAKLFFREEVMASRMVPLIASAAACKNRELAVRKANLMSRSAEMNDAFEKYRRSTEGAGISKAEQELVGFEADEINTFEQVIKAFQAEPSNASSRSQLADLRKGIADYLLGVQPSDLKSLMSGSFGRVFDLILNSGLQDEALATEELTFAESLVGGFDVEGQFDIRRLTASMLFLRAHRTAALLAVELIPSWFFENYINYLIFSPEAFQEIGEAEMYRKQIHNVLSEFWRRIEGSPRSPLSLKLSQVIASRLNLIPLYFNEQGNKDTYILRSKFIGHFLESRGLKLAETGQKTSSTRKRIKVGFLNAHFTSQTETYTTIPTFSHLDRSKFEVVLYCLGASDGPLENFCRNCADAFVVLPQALDEQIKKIRADKLDALVIGTNVTAVTNQAALLASARLAPVQLINNSSPVTSGMPHVDGYLSGTFLVAEKSGEDYSEKLCLLDGPSHCFNYEVDRHEPVVKLDRAGLGIPQDAVVYFSGANCFKIIPEMQEAWARILAKVPGSVLLLHPFNPNWASQYPVRRFERNMLAALARHGVEANRLVLSRDRLPSRSDVLELIKLSDIYLDSFPFAGVNSAVDPLEVGIPLVACEMQTFRSRMAGSLLRELKIEELIAAGEEEYIDLATKLGLDSAYRAEVSQKIVFAMGQNPRFLDSAAYSANMGRIIESLVGRSLPEAMPKVGDFTMQDAQVAFAEGRLSDAEDICREILGNDERCAGAWYLMGKMAVLQGDLETAGDFASVACDLEPENAEFVRGLAEVFFYKKELVSAEEQVKRALELAPDSSEGLVLQGRILADKGEKSAALEAFQEAVRLRKDFADGFSHYALALQKFGRGKDAISQIRKACALEPDSVEFQTNLAMLLEQNARYVDALAAYGKAARMNPNVGFVWFRQGRLLNGLKRYAEAIPLFEKAVALPGQMGEYHYEYGLALHMCKRFQEALAQYQKALSMGYNTAALQCNCGVIYKDLRKGGDAIMAFHSAVTMEPTNVSYLNNLGAAALELGLNSEALECFEQAVEKNPKLPTARNNIGNLLKDRSRGMDALPQYRKSIELNPDDRDVQSNYLLCHMYIPDMDPKVVFEEHKKWGVAASKKIPPAFKFKPRQSGAKLRVGFLSADLCHHPVAYFIESLFREYDRGQFEFVAYGDQRNSDDFSARFAKQVNLWRETSSYDDSKLAKLIHEDQLDILFELSGHTAYNRLGVFALKPAPLQVSYLGYPGTTGLPTIGYRITDAFADPPGTTEHLHTEKLIRLKGCAWCFQPDAAAPEVQPLPALKNGYVTFGCFNNMAKLNPPLFETWAEILLRVPGSHLRLKARTLTDDGVRKELKAYFTDRGIEEERLDFFGHTKKIVEHLSHYHSVDIALDSFPYHGTTTTCEAMWMGCPVITRAGKTHVSRVGVSLLNNVGLTEFITDTRETYIAKAAELASDTERLIELRAGMRARLQSSPIMDASAFAGNFAQALNEIAVDR